MYSIHCIHVVDPPCKGKLMLIKGGKQFEECAVNREVWLPSQTQSGEYCASNESAFGKLLHLVRERCQNFSLTVLIVDR